MRKPALILCAALAMLCGCAVPAAPASTPAPTPVQTPAPTQPPAKKVALILPNGESSASKLLFGAFSARAKHAGYEVVLASADDANEYELCALGEQLLSEDISGALLVVKSDAAYPLIKKFNAAGVSTVVADYYHDEAKISQLDANVYHDHAQSGAAAAKAMLSALAKAGKKSGRIGIVYQAGSEAQSAAEAFERALEGSGFELSECAVGADPAATAAEIANYLAADDPHGLFLAHKSGTALYAFINAKPRNQRIVISLEDTVFGLEQIQRGEIYAALTYPYETEGEMCFDALLKLMLREGCVYANPISAQLITAETVQEYLSSNDDI